jgi:hypothetical protein
MATLKKAFPKDTLVIWGAYDYSDPATNQVGHFNAGDQVVVLERKFPGVLVKWANGTTGWVCEWNVE